MEPLTLIDLERYPITELEGAGGSVAERHAGELRTNGVSILPGFVRPDALPDRVAECEALAAGAYLQDVQGTPYLELPDAATWPTDLAERAAAWNPFFRPPGGAAE